MKFQWVLAAVCAAAGLAGTPVVAGPLLYDEVTSNVINGSDVPNGSFTIFRNQGVEIGLRASLRFDSNNDPAAVYNWDGNHTYSFPAGSPNPGVGSPLPSWADATTPIWNFDWSINTNYTGTSAYPTVGTALVGHVPLTFQMTIDFDPSASVLSLPFPFDSIYGAGSAPDHSFGDNMTVQGAGLEAANSTQYQSYLTSYNLVQNSWNMEFFNIAPPLSFDPNVPGEYTITLSALEAGTTIASSSINVVVTAVPEASSFLAVGLVGLVGWCVKKRLGA
jgi:hypothetical protein